MYVLLRMPFKVYPVPCFINFLPECALKSFELLENGLLSFEKYIAWKMESLGIVMLSVLILASHSFTGIT